MKHKFLLIYSWIVRTVLFFLPDVPILMRFRGFLYSFGMEKCGKDFQVAHDVKLVTLEKIRIGNHCYIAYTSLLLAGGGIELEDQVMIGPQCVLVSGNHTSNNGAYRFGKSISGRILIQRGAWVGAHSTVLMNSTLPINSCLGANSLLNKNYSIPNALYAGIPAIHLKTNT